MKRTFSFLFALILCHFVTASDETRRCDINQFLDRPARALGSEELIERLQGFSRTELIVALEAIHISRYQSGALRRATFNLMWILNDREASELLFGSFENGLIASIAENGTPRQLNLPEFVDQYETDYVRANGTLSRLWTEARRVEGQPQTDKQRFLKRVMLELAYRHQKRLDAAEGQQPIHFTRAPESDLSLLPGYAVLCRAFGGEPRFQAAYRDYERRRERGRTPALPYRRFHEYERVHRELIVAGRVGSHFGRRAPVRREDATTRNRNELVESAARAIVESSAPRFLELSAIPVESTDTEHESHFSLGGDLYQRIRNLFGNMDRFVEELNARIDPPLERGPGTGSWVQELLVQLGVAHVRASGGRAAFTGFQASDPADTFYVNPIGDIFRASGLTVRALNNLVLQRLP